MDPDVIRGNLPPVITDPSDMFNLSNPNISSSCPFLEQPRLCRKDLDITNYDTCIPHIAILDRGVVVVSVDCTVWIRPISRMHP